MNTGPTEDRLAIRELIESFAVGAIRLDGEMWGENWDEDGVWKLMSMPEPVHGKANIVESFNKVMSYVKSISMICFPAEMVVEGNQAHGRAYCRELIFPKSGGQVIVLGCYRDEYVKRDGRWYFKSRFYEVIDKIISEQAG